MTHAIKRMQAEITALDTYTQLSVLGSWSFMINAACINAATKFVPDSPVDNGIEQFTPYEAARRALIKEAENDNSSLPALLCLQRDLQGMIYEADGQGRGLEDTLSFLTDKSPKREDFGSDYDQRVRMGLKPGMSRRQFIDYEFERAMNQHNLLVARGEDAVRLCDTVTVNSDRGYTDLPDWVSESFQRKLIEKLHTRWEKLEMSRTNPRRSKQIRDSAAADQLSIVKLLAQYDETPGFDADEHDEQLDSIFNGSLDHIVADPKAPGPVTIIKPDVTA